MTPDQAHERLIEEMAEGMYLDSPWGEGEPMIPFPDLPDVEQAIWFDLACVALSVVRTARDSETCTHCGGSGYEHSLTRNPEPDTSKCGACDGTGSRPGVLLITRLTNRRNRRIRGARGA